MTTTTKSAVIWNEIEDLRYLVLDGDLSKFEGVYINSTNSDEELQRQLNDTIYNEEGLHRFKFVTLNEFAEAIRAGAVAVECGFLP